jgi:hypothetical protein
MAAFFQQRGELGAGLLAGAVVGGACFQALVQAGLFQLQSGQGFLPFRQLLSGQSGALLQTPSLAQGLPPPLQPDLFPGLGLGLFLRFQRGLPHGSGLFGGGFQRPQLVLGLCQLPLGFFQGPVQPVPLRRAFQPGLGLPGPLFGAGLLLAQLFQLLLLGL